MKKKRMKFTVDYMFDTGLPNYTLSYISKETDKKQFVFGNYNLVLSIPWNVGASVMY